MSKLVNVTDVEALTRWVFFEILSPLVGHDAILIGAFGKQISQRYHSTVYFNMKRDCGILVIEASAEVAGAVEVGRQQNRLTFQSPATEPIGRGSQVYPQTHPVTERSAALGIPRNEKLLRHGMHHHVVRFY